MLDALVDFPNAGSDSPEVTATRDEAIEQTQKLLEEFAPQLEYVRAIGEAIGKAWGYLTEWTKEVTVRLAEWWQEHSGRWLRVMWYSPDFRRNHGSVWALYTARWHALGRRPFILRP